MKLILPYLKTVLFFAAILTALSPVFSQNKKADCSLNSGWAKKPFERKAFIENKGQYASDLPLSKNQFSYCIDNGAKVFFYNNEVLFYFTKSVLTKEEEKEEKEDPEEERRREMQLQKKEKQFISMKWLNASPDAVIEVSDEQTSDYGYVISKNVPKIYTAHCRGYNKLKIKNLYKGIDAEYYFTEKGGFKYNLYVSEGADIKQVQQFYDGAENIELIEGSIVVKTVQGDITDHAPVSFTAADPGKKIAGSFLLQKNTVSFDIQNPDNQAMVIDPWVTVPAMAGAAVDNGIDQYGNIYVTSAAYILEKYSHLGVLISSTDVMAGDATIYGDMLTDSRGYCFFNTVGFHARGDATAVDSAGNFLWDSQGITECWRFVLNECNHQVLSLTGYRHSSTGFAKINTATGALAGYTQSGACCQDPHCGVIDFNGDVYSVASDGGTLIYKWTPGNTIAATYPAAGSWGYGSGYVGDGSFAQGYNGMAILGNNLYLFDGADLFKVNKTNGAIVSQVTVPGGINKHNGGIYITSCGKIFVGSSTGVYMYDLNFNQIDFKATSGPVFDLAFNNFNQTINACGPGHVTELAFVIPPCIFQTHPFVKPACGGLSNSYIKLNLAGGVPDYTFTWSKNGTVLAQAADSIGGLGVGTYKCVYSDNKCPVPSKDSTTVIVPFLPNPASAFSFHNVCGSLVPLTDSSYISQGTIHSWKWNFDDGSPLDTNQTVSGGHIYLHPGAYNVKLLVVSDSGCADSVIKIIHVYSNPSAAFTAKKTCDGAAMPFTDNSTIITGSIASWSWNFGDLTPVSTLQNPNHLYAVVGTYPVKLIVTSISGCKDTITKNVTVHPLPVSQFSFEDKCKGSIVPFNNLSSIIGTDSIQMPFWNFGDGSFVNNNQNPTHLFPDAGAYSVQLLNVSNYGCRDSISKIITINPYPVVSFTAPDTAGCAPLCVNFNPNVSIASGTNTVFLWNFGDGAASGYSENPKHCYANSSVTLPKTFDVSLTVTSDSGCVTTFAKTHYIIVNPDPASNFFVDPKSTSIINPVITLTDLSAGANGWNWNLGDNTSSILQNPLPHSYADTGQYKITQIVSNQYSCFDTTFQTITIQPDWAFYIPNAFSPNGDGINDSFQGYGYGILEYEMFIFDRWGNQIFHTVDYDFPWNGKANGGKEKAQMDVYVYLINIKDVKKAVHSYKGIVTLVR